MTPLYQKEDFLKANSKDKLPCQCIQCKNTFFITKHQIQRALNLNHNVKANFCSQKCQGHFKSKKQKINCKNCDKKFEKLLSEIKKTKNHFCSQSCAATYNNLNKKYGIRRSKLEIFIEEQLTILYPNLHIDYNKKEAINSELDIYIPHLKLAVELNGIFHYEPIYGIKRLNNIQENDSNKFKKCIENDISLCIIDTSAQKYFKISSSQKYLEIIINIINNKIKNHQ